MAKRFIDQSILLNPRFNRLHVEARELFIRLLLYCDTLGRFQADPDAIRVNCYPVPIRNVINVTKISAALNDLADNGSIALYQVDEQPIGEMPSYLKYNNWPHKRSTLPALAGNEHQQIRFTGKSSGSLQVSLLEDLVEDLHVVPRKTCYYYHSYFHSKRGEADVLSVTPIEVTDRSDAQASGGQKTPLLATSETPAEPSEGEPSQTIQATPLPRDIERPKSSEPPQEAYHVADALRTSVIAANPSNLIALELKWPVTRRNWACDVRLAHTEDGRAYKDLFEVARWLPDAERKGDFCWSDVVTSADKLRRHFDALSLAMSKKTAESASQGSGKPYKFGVAGTEVDAELPAAVVEAERRSLENMRRQNAEWSKQFEERVASDEQ